MDKIKLKRKSYFNSIILGAANSGRSSIAENLLYNSNKINKNMKNMKNNNVYKKNINFEEEEDNNETSIYSNLIHKLKMDKEKDIIIDLPELTLETSNYFINIIDVSGHKNFIKNMILGYTNANVAILVISAYLEYNELIINEQIKTQIILCFNMGIKEIIITINKIDICEYSEDVFNNIKKEIIEYILEKGYKEQNIKFIPLSGLTGENIIDPS
jgi:elongation factor 1-alpha